MTLTCFDHGICSLRHAPSCQAILVARTMAIQDSPRAEPTNRLDACAADTCRQDGDGAPVPSNEIARLASVQQLQLHLLEEEDPDADLQHICAVTCKLLRVSATGEAYMRMLHLCTARSCCCLVSGFILAGGLHVQMQPLWLTPPCGLVMGSAQP